ncbi:MAG: hypothetical protein ACYDDB_02745 [bacterium]
MKKKSKTIKNRYGCLNKKRSYISVKLLALIFFAPLLFLSGCAKTEYPLPPKIAPPRPPVILSAEKLKNTVKIVYKYSGGINKVKGFLIYRKYYKDKKSIKYSCNLSKPFVFQNLAFKKIFSLQYNKFFYNVNKNNLKKGYYMFCVQSVGDYNIKSAYSNYVIVQIVI